MSLYHLKWTPGTGYGSGKLSGTAEAVLPDAPAPAFKSLQTIKPAATTTEPAGPPTKALAAALNSGLKADRRPVTIMVHGFNFNPTPGGATVDKDSPYAGVYAPPDKAGVMGKQYTNASWWPIVGLAPRPDRGEESDPPVIAFAWDSQPDGIFDGSLGWSNFYEGALYDLAPGAGRALAAVVVALAAQGRKVRFVAHSLGTRTVLKALGFLHEADEKAAMAAVTRCLFMAGAQYAIEVEEVVALYPKTAFINIGHRKDFVLTELGQKMDTRRTILGLDGNLGEVVMRTIGARGFHPKATNWLDLQADAKPNAKGQTLGDWFGDENWGAFNVDPYDLDGVERRLHFAIYTWPENKTILHRLLTGQTGGDPLGTWRKAGIPEGYDYPGYTAKASAVVDPKLRIPDPPIEPKKRLKERTDLIDKYRH